MEHGCYQCGATVEDGVAFCRQCKAPQITVSGPDPSTGLQHASTSVVPAFAPPSLALPLGNPSRIGAKSWWPEALLAAFIGLLIASFLAVVLRGALVVGMLTAGFASVYFHRRRNPFNELSLRSGAGIGAFTGVLAFFLLALTSAITIFVLHSAAKVHALALKASEQYVSGNSDPQVQQILDFYKTSEGFVVMLVVGSIFMLLLCIALSTMGGMIGAKLLRKKGEG